MEGFAYACGFTVHWFRLQADAEAAHAADMDAMRAGEIPANCVSPLEPCSAAAAADWAAPFTPSDDWRPSLVIRRRAAA